MAFFGQQSQILPKLFLATADQIFTSATLTDSTYLQANLLANTKYQITIGLIVFVPDEPAEQKLQAKWVQTSGSSFGSWIGIGNNQAYGGDGVRQLSYISNKIVDTETFLSLDLNGNGQVGFNITMPINSFIASVGAIGGISKVQFANTDPAPPSDLFIKTNSYMIVTQLS